MNNQTHQQAIELIAANDDPNKLLETLKTALDYTRIMPGFDRELETILKREFIRMVDTLIIEAKKERRGIGGKERVRSDILNFRIMRRQTIGKLFFETKRIGNNQWGSLKATYILDRCTWLNNETYSSYGIEEFNSIEDLLASIETYGDWHEWQVIDPKNASYRNRQYNQEND